MLWFDHWLLLCCEWMSSVGVWFQQQQQRGVGWPAAAAVCRWRQRSRDVRPVSWLLGRRSYRRTMFSHLSVSRVIWCTANLYRYNLIWFVLWLCSIVCLRWVKLSIIHRFAIVRHQRGAVIQSQQDGKCWLWGEGPAPSGIKWCTVCYVC